MELPRSLVLRDATLPQALEHAHAPHAAAALDVPYVAILLELLSVAVERRLKRRAAVDLSPHLSVDADAPEEGSR